LARPLEEIQRPGAADLLHREIMHGEA